MSIGTPQALGKNSNSGAGVISTTLTLGAAIQAGDLVVVAFGAIGANLVQASAVSDGTNTYTKVGAVNNGSSTNIELWAVANAAAVASGTVTVTHNSSSGAGSTRLIEAARVAGVAASGAVDQVATQNTTGASPSVTTGTLSQASEIAFGTLVNAAATSYTESSGFTNLELQTGQALSYEIVGSAAAITYAPTLAANSDATETILATFKGAPAVDQIVAARQLGQIDPPRAPVETIGY